ncbi:hypothetical protein HMI49_04055 [Corallococcus exercitus]|uniref:Uncharacterized protein n=1 Tax=Corallococcus exercitus TaxID=2316736 RepID=A0A7Y4KGP2_9BACT|nr:hypothetical protein [Corallococcus exercitus]NOK32374.1 hypothetical protein [Corallococcus exercitus]
MAELHVYQYRLRTEKGAWLADVILRSDGYFSTVSDWGNYAFRWTAPGREFRAFVAHLAGQDDYVCSKLSQRTWFDGAATLKSIREHILTSRRDGSWTKEHAAKEWQALAEALGRWSGREARSCDSMDLYEYFRWHDGTSIDDASELASYNYEPDVRGFCENVMPALATAIRAQLQGEAATATHQASGCEASRG